MHQRTSEQTTDRAAVPEPLFDDLSLSLSLSYVELEVVLCSAVSQTRVTERRSPLLYEQGTFTRTINQRMSTTLHMTAPGAHTHTHSHSHSHSHTHTLSLSLSAMSAQPQFSRPTVRYYQAAAVAVLSVLCVLALAVRADVPSAQRTLGRRQQYTPKLSCLGAVLMAQSSIQDKLSWTFTPPPMVPSGRTIQIGSLVILATRSGLAWRA